MLFQEQRKMPIALVQHPYRKNIIHNFSATSSISSEIWMKYHLFSEITVIKHRNKQCFPMLKKEKWNQKPKTVGKRVSVSDQISKQIRKIRGIRGKDYFLTICKRGSITLLFTHEISLSSILQTICKNKNSFLLSPCRSIDQKIPNHLWFRKRAKTLLDPFLSHLKQEESKP